MTQAAITVPQGGDYSTVAVGGGASIGTNVIKVLIDDATAANKQIVLDALELVKQKIINGAWPLG